jgi:hypothetical protein
MDYKQQRRTLLVLIGHRKRTDRTFSDSLLNDAFDGYREPPVCSSACVSGLFHEKVFLSRSRYIFLQEAGKKTLELTVNLIVNSLSWFSSYKHYSLVLRYLLDFIVILTPK